MGLRTQQHRRSTSGIRRATTENLPVRHQTPPPPPIRSATFTGKGKAILVTRQRDSTPLTSAGHHAAHKHWSKPGRESHGEPLAPPYGHLLAPEVNHAWVFHPSTHERSTETAAGWHGEVTQRLPKLADPPGSSTQATTPFSHSAATAIGATNLSILLQKPRSVDTTFHN